MSANQQLFEAIYQGDLKKVEKLIEQEGANPNARTRDHRSSTPLMEAVVGGYTEVASYLLSKGADINAQDSDKWSSLMLATINNFVATAGFLIDRGADLEAKTDYVLHTALYLAAERSSPEMVSLLLEKGADTTAKSDIGDTPLFCAASLDRTDIVEILLKKNPDMLHVKNTYHEQTPFFIAAKNNAYKTMAFLLENGANLYDQDVNGKTAFDYASTIEAKNILHEWKEKLEKQISTSPQTQSRPMPSPLKGIFGRTAIKRAIRSGKI